MSSIWFLREIKKEPVMVIKNQNGRFFGEDGQILGLLSREA